MLLCGIRKIFNIKKIKQKKHLLNKAALHLFD